MKKFEANYLLAAAREVSRVLQVGQASVPVEGYYAETPELTEYFLLMRTLQGIDESEIKIIDNLAAYQLLLEVTSSDIYGETTSKHAIFPGAVDVIYEALQSIPVHQWESTSILKEAKRRAKQSESCSLVAIAALASDLVCLAALRESTVLYADVLCGSAYNPEPIEYVYEWQVTPEVEAAACRFVTAFNLFSQSGADTLPLAIKDNAETYYSAYEDCDILDRCVRIGYDDSTTPYRHYHWAIIMKDGQYAVEEFWDSEIWTTERYRINRRNF